MYAIERYTDSAHTCLSRQMHEVAQRPQQLVNVGHRKHLYQSLACSLLQDEKSCTSTTQPHEAHSHILDHVHACRETLTWPPSTMKETRYGLGYKQCLPHMPPRCADWSMPTSGQLRVQDLGKKNHDISLNRISILPCLLNI